MDGLVATDVEHGESLAGCSKYERPLYEYTASVKLFETVSLRDSEEKMILID